MARIRTVKPELFRHEALFEAEQESGLPLRLAFIGLFTVCDREGIFRWKPRQLKLDVMPYDGHDFSRVLDALATRGFVIHYACGSDEYGVIPSFLRHQVINNREKSSDFPCIDVATHIFNNEIKDMREIDSRVEHASITRHENVQGEGKGREWEQEGKGNGSSRQARQHKVNISVEQMVDSIPGLSAEAAGEYLAFRKSKKAPLTSGAWKAIVKEIVKSGLEPVDALNTAMARGWQGFDASWLKSGQRSYGGIGISKQEQIEAANQRVVDEIMARQTVIGDLSGFQEGVIVIDGEVIHAN